MARDHSLRKYEILRAKNLTERLFRTGKSAKGDFLTIVYTAQMPETAFFRGNDTILFAVSKRNVPSSVVRNRVKRLMREAYRLEKPFARKTTGTEPQPFCIAFIYTARKKKIPGLEVFRSEMNMLMKHPGSA
ncbi:MAG: ribonuclease P protein component [Chlorobiaceae bacterium]|nr:ribonuclease P protein component [Chlorobiaceae bacterium]NTW10192.1 ribonuclease P protein component [Chlorobiaceae bacterium]